MRHLPIRQVARFFWLVSSVVDGVCVEILQAHPGSATEESLSLVAPNLRISNARRFLPASL